MSNLTESFKETIFNKDVDDAMNKLAIVELNQVFDDAVLDSIPFLKTIIGTANCVIDARNLFLLHKTAAFIKEFHSGTIDEGKLARYKKRMENQKRAEKECGRVLLILDQIVETEKAELLAKVYKAYIYDCFDWDTFCELTTCIQMMFLQDLDLLSKIAKRESIDISKSPHRINRLLSLGLITTPFTDGTSIRWINLDNSSATISDLGTKFYKYAIKGKLQ